MVNREQIKVFCTALVLQGIFVLLGDVGLRASLQERVREKDDLVVEMNEAEAPAWVEEIFQVVQNNPDVPENMPDKTQNIAEKSQQAAQEESSTTLEQDFVSDGDLETSSQLFADLPIASVKATQAVVSGELQPASPSAKKTTESPETNVARAQDFQKQQIFEREGDSPVGVDVDGDTQTEKSGQAETETKVIQIGSPSVAERPETESATWQEIAQSNEPQPRPQIDRSLLPYLTRKSMGNINRYGQLSLEADSRFMQFAKYHRTMMEAIVQQWYNLAEEVNISQADSGSMTTVSFVLQPDGQISEVEVTHSSARNVATIICKDAIASRAPFAEWNQQMRDILPQPFPVKISFHYR